ncbi:hypothetical protein HDU76_011684 [Blyttiomyces sp. JEL0837]|nr:hypothetical protein HDU76_011684 [Blyttiomyces sp. JEL0837]
MPREFGDYFGGGGFSIPFARRGEDEEEEVEEPEVVPQPAPAVNKPASLPVNAVATPPAPTSYSRLDRMASVGSSGDGSQLGTDEEDEEDEPDIMEKMMSASGSSLALSLRLAGGSSTDSMPRSLARKASIPSSTSIASVPAPMPLQSKAPLPLPSKADPDAIDKMLSDTGSSLSLSMKLESIEELSKTYSNNDLSQQQQPQQPQTTTSTTATTIPKKAGNLPPSRAAAAAATSSLGGSRLAQTAETSRRASNASDFIFGGQNGSVALSSALAGEGKWASKVSEGDTASGKTLLDDTDGASPLVLRGGQIGSVKLSDMMSDAGKAITSEKPAVRGGQSGSVKLSEMMTGASLHAPKPTNDKNASTATLVSSLSGVSAKKIGAVPVTISDTDSVAEILSRIALEHEWTTEELQDDLNALRKNRIRSVKDLRRLTAQGWNEMSYLLPITKDLLRSAVGWTPEGAGLGSKECLAQDQNRRIHLRSTKPTMDSNYLKHAVGPALTSALTSLLTHPHPSLISDPVTHIARHLLHQDQTQSSQKSYKLELQRIQSLKDAAVAKKRSIEDAKRRVGEELVRYVEERQRRLEREAERERRAAADAEKAKVDAEIEAKRVAEEGVARKKEEEAMQAQIAATQAAVPAPVAKEPSKVAVVEGEEEENADE